MPVQMPVRPIHDAIAGRACPGRARSDLSHSSDDELLALVHHDSAVALAELYRRHYADALRYARGLLRRYPARECADDVVSEAVRKVLTALRHGHGPTIGFRQYLYTAIRTVVTTRRSTTRDEATLDEAPDDDSPAADDGLDAIVAMSAFQALPERWRRVLWMTKVDAMTPTEIAPLIDMRANSVAALAARARDALRISFVRAHLPHCAERQCSDTLDIIAQRAVVAITAAQDRRASAHLLECDDCREAADRVNREIAAWTRAAGAIETNFRRSDAAPRCPEVAVA